MASLGYWCLLIDCLVSGMQSPQERSCVVVLFLPSTHTGTVPPHRAKHTSHIVDQEPEL